MTINELTIKAESGDANAQYELGEIYWDGTNGVQKDYSKAAEWYEKAAKQGQIDAIQGLHISRNLVWKNFY